MTGYQRGQAYRVGRQITAATAAARKSSPQSRQAGNHEERRPCLAGARKPRCHQRRPSVRRSVVLMRCCATADAAGFRNRSHHP